MTLQVGVKVLIENSEGLYLFLKRSTVTASEIQNSWDIPGGRINSDEKLIEALKREVLEEINYELKSIPRLISAQDIFVTGKDLHVVRLTYITKEEVPNILLSDEHEEYVWRSLNDIYTMVTDPYLKEVLQTLK